METITIREQPDGLLTVQVGRAIVAMNVDESEVLAIVETELTRGEDDR